MNKFAMRYLKHAFFLIFSMGIIPSKAWAGLLLPMAIGNGNFLKISHIIGKAEAFLCTGKGILLIGFLLWIGYVVFLFPKDTLKQS